MSSFVSFSTHTSELVTDPLSGPVSSWTTLLSDMPRLLPTNLAASQSLSSTRAVFLSQALYYSRVPVLCLFSLPFLSTSIALIFCECSFFDQSLISSYCAIKWMHEINWGRGTTLFNNPCSTLWKQYSGNLLCSTNLISNSYPEGYVDTAQTPRKRLQYEVTVT